MDVLLESNIERRSQKASVYRASQCLEMVHIDLCGQVTPPTPGGKQYFLLVVDDHSRYMWLELMATKDEAFTHFKRYKVAAELELNQKIKAFRSDRGGEFNSRAVVDFC
jgi:hypothetical protein